METGAPCNVLLGELEPVPFVGLMVEKVLQEPFAWFHGL